MVFLRCAFGLFILILGFTTLYFIPIYTVYHNGDCLGLSSSPSFCEFFKLTCRKVRDAEAYLFFRHGIVLPILLTNHIGLQEFCFNSLKQS